jgi:hypothetical protein
MQSSEESWSESGQLSAVLASFNSSTDLSREEVRQLVGWLFEPDRFPAMQRLACTGIHLIS